MLARIAVVLVLTTVVARADDAPPPALARTAWSVGIATLETTTGIYSRLSHRLGKRTRIHLVGHYGLEAPGGMLDTPQGFAELGFDVRGVRFGALARKYVPEIGASPYAYTESMMLGAFAGYGIGVERQRVRAMLVLDVLTAPLLTKNNFYDAAGARLMYTDTKADRIGGRIGVMTNIGQKRYGVSVDMALGYMPGLDLNFFALVSLGLYIGR